MTRRCGTGPWKPPRIPGSASGAAGGGGANGSGGGGAEEVVAVVRRITTCAVPPSWGPPSFHGDLVRDCFLGRRHLFAAVFFDSGLIRRRLLFGSHLPLGFRHEPLRAPRTSTCPPAHTHVIRRLRRWPDRERRRHQPAGKTAGVHGHSTVHAASSTVPSGQRSRPPSSARARIARTVGRAIEQHNLARRLDHGGLAHGQPTRHSSPRSTPSGPPQREGG